MAATATSSPLTFLFTDLEGSTRLWEAFPDRMQGALARHDEILRQAIEANGGRLIKTTGDGVHAVFESGHGGVAAALQAQQTLARSSWEDPHALCGDRPHNGAPAPAA
jgi:class 3 adenylate cyclase